MPWWEMVSMDLRLQFISEYLSGLFSMTELATQYRDQPQDGLQMGGAVPDHRPGRAARSIATTA